MSKINFDVDIDFFNRDDALALFPNVTYASINDHHKKHNTGVYFQDIPRTGDRISTINYKDAEDLGYFKLDFINASVYEGVKNEEHLNRLCSEEPLWDLLMEEDFTSKLFHIGSYHELVLSMRPRSIEHLAMLLAIIRPSKKHLQGKSWDEVRNSIWDKPSDGSYHFKKSHAMAYALAIVVQMNLIVEKALSQ